MMIGRRYGPLYGVFAVICQTKSKMLLGLHHVTALAGDAQANLDYYTQELKLRLVKRTVNFDDPGTYHLYFGDARGSPGTLLTFFTGFQRPAKVGSVQIVAGLSLEQVDGEAPKLHSVTLCENDLEPTARFLERLGFAAAGG